MMRSLAIILSILLTATVGLIPARAENLVGGSSNNSISITSNFAGEIITLFGAVELSVGQTAPIEAAGAINIIVRVIGPDANIVARKKNVALWGVAQSRKGVFQECPRVHFN